MLRFPEIILRPYPLPLNNRNLLTAPAVYGLIIAFLLWFFAPFGLNSAPPFGLRVIIAAQFGFITFLGSMFCLISLLLLRAVAWVKEENWTVGKEVLWLLFNFIVIGFMNFTFVVFKGWSAFDLGDVVKMQFITLFVGIWPVSVGVVLKHNRLLKEALQSAEGLRLQWKQEHIDLNDRSKDSSSVDYTDNIDVTILGSNRGEKLNFQLNDLLFIQASGNYLEVYLKNAPSFRPVLLRNTISDMENQLSRFSNIKRCHRSYMVNLGNAQEVQASAQGLSIVFSDLNRQIPVSKTYANSFSSANEAVAKGMP